MIPEPARTDPWSVVPEPRAPAPGLVRDVALGLAAFGLGVAAPALHLALRTEASDGSIALLLLAAAGWVVVLGAGLGRWWWGVAVTTIAGAGALALGRAQVGLAPTSVALLGVAVAHAALVRWAPLPGWPPRRDRTATLALGPLLAAGATWYRTASRPITLALLLLGLAVVEAHHRAPEPAARAQQAVARALARLGAVIGGTIVGLVLLPLVYVPGAVGRAAQRMRRNRQRRMERSNWQEATGTVADERLDARRPFAAASPRSRAIGNVAAVVLLLVAALAIGRLTADDSRTRLAGPATTTTTAIALDEPDPAYADAPWEAMLRLSSGGFLRYDPAGGHRIADVRSPYVNVSDGERRTRSTALTGADPIEVWFLGGSAAFGSGQRDEHTIPSELVRAAEEDGVALRVRNLAVPATSNWQEAMRFAYLAEWREPPDLVVFYDGFNDAFGQLVLNVNGGGASDEVITAYQGEFDEALLGEGTQIPAELAPLEILPEPAEPPVEDPALLADAIVRRYARGLDTIRTLADEHDLPVEVFWQPTLVTKPAPSDAEQAVLQAQGLAGVSLDLARQVYDLLDDRLPDLGVEDLGDVLDGVEEPVYLDVVHTNEDGARIVAEALYERLEPRLRALG